MKCNCEPGVVAPADNYKKIGACTEVACSLHTIRIPKHHGSDVAGEPYAPKLGSYQNAIVYYEASGAVYIYDEAGVYTSLTGTELSALIMKVQEQLENTSERVVTLEAGLENEIKLRVDGQTALQALVEALQGQLNAEADTRKAEDDKLNTALNTLQSKVTDLTNAGNTETADREAAVSDLESKLQGLNDALESEADIRGQADTQLSTSVENLRTAVENLSGDIEGDLGTVLNLPATVLQSTTMNGSNNAITLQTSGVTLASGDPATDTSTVNLKTLNGQTLIGTGDIEIEVPEQSFKTINNTEITGTGNISVQPTLISGTNIKTINGASILGGGDISVAKSSELISVKTTVSFIPAHQSSTGGYNLRTAVSDVFNIKEPGIYLVQCAHSVQAKVNTSAVDVNNKSPLVWVMGLSKAPIVTSFPALLSTWSNLLLFETTATNTVLYSELGLPSMLSIEAAGDYYLCSYAYGNALQNSDTTVEAKIDNVYLLKIGEI